MSIDKDILYDQIRLAVDVSDVADDRIRYNIVGEEFDVDINHIVYSYNLEQKTPLDLLSQIFMTTYEISIVIISRDESLITQIQSDIRSQMQSYFVDYNIISVGDSPILKDDELGVFSSSIQFQLTFN
jgi:hypothetical protein